MTLSGEMKKQHAYIDGAQLVWGIDGMEKHPITFHNGRYTRRVFLLRRWGRSSITYV